MLIVNSKNKLSSASTWCQIRHCHFWKSALLWTINGYVSGLWTVKNPAHIFLEITLSNLCKMCNVLKASKDELCQCDLPDMTGDFQNASQSDEELAILDVADSINPPQNRFKSTSKLHRREQREQQTSKLCGEWSYWEVQFFSPSCKSNMIKNNIM